MVVHPSEGIERVFGGQGVKIVVHPSDGQAIWNRLVLAGQDPDQILVEHPAGIPGHPILFDSTFLDLLLEPHDHDNQENTHADE